jgi:4,5-dihydroxyphthalate decarboxylase
VAEFSLSWYVAARTRGEPVVALPIFPLRMPVLAYLFCRGDASYGSPHELVGKRIGVPCYRYTVNLWLRGILQEHYGLAPNQVKWFTQLPEGAGFVPPGDIDITLTGRSTEEMLARGEVDAIMVPVLPESFVRADPGIRRLFRDCRAELRSFTTRTGMLPITHTVVMKESVLEREPWVARSLEDAFTEASRQMDAYYDRDPKRLGLSEAVLFLDDERKVYGPNRWSHGLGSSNRKVLETFVRYAHEQGYISRLPALEELFPTVAS